MYSHKKLDSRPGLAAAPVDLDEVKVHLRLFGDDTVTDDYLEALIQTAVEIASTCLGRSVGESDYSAYYTDFTDLSLPEVEVGAISSVQYYNTNNTLTTVSSDDYFLDDTGRVPCVERVSGSWPTDLHTKRKAPVVVSYDTEMGERGQLAVGQAILIIIADLYNNPSSLDEANLKEVPFSAKMLLNPYRRESP